MTDQTQFGRPVGCEACEAMCLDAVDGTLTAAEQVVFDRHVAGCVECAEQFSEAQRGAAWMEMLKGHQPEPPAGMLQRILAQTSEAEMSKVFPRFGVVPTPRFAVVPKIGFQERMLDKFAAAFALDMRQTHFQPRMAMTAAMAFFSLALTMNLSGIRLADLRPGAIHRSVADVKASAARTIQNMRVVYQVESKVNELRNDDRTSGGVFAPENAAPKQPAPEVKPEPKPQEEKPKQPAPPNGTSELIVPETRMQQVSKKSDEQEIAPGAEALRVQRGA